MFRMFKPRFIEITTDAGFKGSVNVDQIVFFSPLFDNVPAAKTRASVIGFPSGATQRVMHSYDELKAMIARA